MTTTAYPIRRRRQLEAEARHEASTAAANVDQTAADQFQTLDVAVLIAGARGDLSLQALAIETLAARGLDANTGRWVGFATARTVAEAIKQQHGIL
jgi:hypothetical protein